ncbi:MAG: PBP1A family penicillin-binding protein [Anaerolineales bacterium]
MKTIKRILRFRYFFAFALVCAVLVAIWLFLDLPSVDRIPQAPQLPSIRITDRYGRLLYDLLADEGGRHTVVAIEDIPDDLINATIATEDSTFYENPGVDLRGILRALWINLRGGETLSGGSTITQQVARNLLLEKGERQQRTLRRKLRESILAWQLAHDLDKDEILALYLNHMYYGAMSYGVEAAAQTYFGKPVRELDLAESALLAGLPQAPSLYNPLTDLDKAKERQQVVLELMEKQEYISTDLRTSAAREQLVFVSSPYPIEAPHFVLMIRDRLGDLVAEDTLYSAGGLTVRTSLDLDWQHHAERIIANQLAGLNQADIASPGAGIGNAALVALDPQTGEILAMVGSPDYFDPATFGAINMAVSPRQPGSAFKPLVYAAALNPTRQDPLTAASMILDVYTAFVTHDGYAYAPVNFDHLEHGPVSLRQALASSLNIPAVRVLDEVGVDRALDLAKNLGITTFGDPDGYDLSLALGGGEVRLLELTAAYAAFANAGQFVAPVAILGIEDAQGHSHYTPDPAEARQVLDPRVAWLITDILSDDDARSIGFGHNSLLQIGRPAAVKTGTTTDFRDNWTIGYLPDLAVGVWVGNADSKPMFNVTGLSGAAPIWHQFMRTVTSGVPEEAFVRPEGVLREEVCALSGLLPSEACPYRRFEWFIRGTEPSTEDDLYQRVTLDRQSMCLADETTPVDRKVVRIVLDLPEEAHSWARSQNLWLLDDLICGIEVVNSGEEHESGQIYFRSPDANTIYRLSPSQPAESQRILIAVGSDRTLDRVTIRLDGISLKSFDGPPYQVWWPLEVGTHELRTEGITPEGESIFSETIHFEVQPAEG